MNNVIGPIDHPTWITMLMLKEDNVNMSKLDSTKYQLAIDKNKSCLRAFFDEILGREQAA